MILLLREIPMQSITLRVAITLTVVVAGAFIQIPTSFAEEIHRSLDPAVMTRDAHLAAPSEATEETIIIKVVDEDGLPAPAERKIKIIRAGSANALDSTAIHRLLKEGLGDKNLPPDVMARLHDALNQDNPLSDMNVDVIVNDQGGHHVVVRDFNPSKAGMDHRMRPNQGIHWMEKAPPDEAAPLNEKAAECILKSLTKVTTESGTRLLREACQAAYPDVSN